MRALRVSLGKSPALMIFTPLPRAGSVAAALPDHKKSRQVISLPAVCYVGTVCFSVQ